jgi:hypothetical protein
VNHVIQHPEIDGQFWSMYGWTALIQAMRFRTDADAREFRDSHGLHGARVFQGKFADASTRPDAMSNYDPFGVGR